MKLSIIKTFLFSAMAVYSLSSCNDWLDVTPKSQIKEEAHFSTEGGYQDQLTGIYTAMSSKSMYGLNMGIGFTEVLSQNYNVNSNGIWRYPSEYGYSNTACESTIGAIWSSTYGCIANLNLLIKNINSADPHVFTDNHYNVIKGEALGLRAFLHFDLMRLFACSPAADNNAKGVPYVTEYSTNVVNQKTVGETMTLIVNDLLVARECLQSDSLKASKNPNVHNVSRKCYFNYYACVGALARAYLWMGDKENALKYAKEIIEQGESEEKSLPFSWVHFSAIKTVHDYECDRTFSSEHLFNLKINEWEDIANYYFKATSGTSSLSPSIEKAMDIYEVNSKAYGNDYRYLKGYDSDGSSKYLCKFWHYENGTYNDMYPLIRMSEAYYIAAECLKDTDPTTAIKYLNEVREARNLDSDPLNKDVTANEIQNEIFKEYRKEFVGEGGQLFFYYKRLNASEIKGAGVTPNKSIYVLPIPSADVEFGGYNN
jgi:SusD family.